MELIYHSLKLQSSTRVEQSDGNSWLVAPGVYIKEMVLNGAYVPAAEIEISAPSWNGRPIPVLHPDPNGAGNGSANTPQIVETAVIGYFYNAAFADGKLSGEMWFDIAKAQAIGGDAALVISNIQNGITVEVSTGYYAYMTNETGVFNGTPYTSVTSHILPDHIAVLPGQIGACSVADGCGVPRTNSREVRMNKAREDTFYLVENMSKFSHKEQAKLLKTAIINSMTIANGVDVWLWLDVWDDFVAYELEVDNEVSFFKRDYTISDNGMVTLGEAVPVIPRKVYDEIPPTVQQNETMMNSIKTFFTNALSGFRKELKMDDLIEAIVTNGKTELTAEQLAELPETAVKAIAAGLSLNEDEGGEGTAVPDPAPAPATTETPPADDEQPAWAKTLMDTVKAIGDDVAAITANQDAADQKETDQLIATLTANSDCLFSEDELKEMPLVHLKKLSLTLTPASYSGLAFGGNVNTNSDDFEYITTQIPVVNEGGE